MFGRLSILLLLLLALPARAQSDGDYYIHVTGPKETIYSISRASGVKVSEIIELNPGFTKSTKLALGQQIRLPKGSVVPGMKPTVPDMVISHPVHMQGPEVSVSGDSVCRIAMLLPFYAKESGFSEAEGVSENIEIPTKAEPFMQFYEGALMALDSLKRAGGKIDLHVFDMTREERSVTEQMQALNDLDPDLVIGPVYENQAALLCGALADQSVPVVYPLSAKSSGLDIYPNFVQVNISNGSFAVEMKKWLEHRIFKEGASAVYLTFGGQGDGLPADVVKELSGMAGVSGFAFPAAGTAPDAAASLSGYLNADKKNYVVVPTLNEAELSRVLPVMLLCSEKFDITLVGLPEWQTFTLVDLEHFFKLNVTLFAYSYTDSSMERMKSFALGFRAYFGTEPSGLACKGYDTMLYFGHMAEKYGKNLLQVLDGHCSDGFFSTFAFGKYPGGVSLENRALMEIRYGKDYQLHIQKVIN